MDDKVIKGNRMAVNLPKPNEIEKDLNKSEIPNPGDLISKLPTNNSLKSNPPPGYSPDDPLEFSKWMSTRQLLEEFPVSARSLYNWRKKKLIPYLFFEGKLLYDRTAFERILKSRWNIVV